MLLNDDSPEFGHSIQRYASDLAISCIAARTQGEFLKALSMSDFDLVCLELVHPEIEGLWALRQLALRDYLGIVLMFNESLPVYSRVAEGMARTFGIRIETVNWPLPEDRVLDLLKNAR
tara:strand:+ start:8142 stop:8498 length:357 start_codon:yes stop_codon:yes gene_type:complete